MGGPEGRSSTWTPDLVPRELLPEVGQARASHLETRVLVPAGSVNPYQASGRFHSSTFPSVKWDPDPSTVETL